MSHYPMYWCYRITQTLKIGLNTLIGRHLRLASMNLLTFVSTFVSGHIKVPEN